MYGNQSSTTEQHPYSIEKIFLFVYVCVYICHVPVEARRGQRGGSICRTALSLGYGSLFRHKLDKVHEMFRRNVICDGVQRRQNVNGGRPFPSPSILFID